MLEDKILTAAITILIGVVIFVFERSLENYIFKPMNKQKECIEDIAVCLTEFADYYANPTAVEHKLELAKNDKSQAGRKMRSLAAELKIYTSGIPLYNTLSRLPFMNKLIAREEVNNAALKLMILSNSFYSGSGVRNSKVADEVRSLLKIERFDR